MAESTVFDRKHLEAVARMFQVLSEATRLQILQALKDGPRTVSELVETLGAKQANVSKQLGILFDAGLVSRERLGNQVVYSVKETMVFDLCHVVCHKLQRDAEQQLQRLRRLSASAPAEPTKSA